MLKKLLTTFLFGLLLSFTAFAQSGTVTGTVTDADTGEPLVGTTVQLVELNRGISSDTDGTFEIDNVPAGDYTLRVSFVGYKTYEQELSVGSGTVTVDVALEEDILGIGEFVVTALGQRTEKNAITFSTQTVDAEKLNITQDANIKTGLAGKVAGVQMVGQAGAKLGSFGDIRIRGAISLTDALAEPLYVLDGVPVTNPNIIDMNNVQSINVLKGPNATALYGQRGENGVILITSKGSGDGGVSVEVTNSTTFENVAYLPNFQNKYGTGYDGAAEWTTLDFDAGFFGYPYPDYYEPLDGEKFIFNGYADESWGPEFDGSEYIAWYNMYPNSPYYGQTSTWDAAPNNIENFYDTGVTSKTGVAVNYSSSRFTSRIAYTNLGQNGILPFSTLNKHFLNGRFDYDVTDDFNVGLSVSYTTREVDGDVLSDGYGNATSGSFNSWFGRQLEMDKMRELKNLTTPEGYSASWNNWGPGLTAYGVATQFAGGTPEGYYKPAFWYNPYTWMDRYDITRKTDNLLLNVDLSYAINDNVEIIGSANTTSEKYSRRYELPYSLSFSAAPLLYNAYVNAFGEYTDERKEHNFSSRVNYQNNFGDITFDGFVGAQARIQQYNRLSADMSLGNYQSGGLIVPDLYNYANSAERIVPIESNWNKQVLSMFAKATFGYQDYLYLDATYRQDYSSALPSDNNGYGYPSVGVSFIFTEFIDNDILTFGKLRAGWAQVGNDVGAEVVNPTYAMDNDPYTNPATGANHTLIYTSGTLIDPNIKPALNSSFEVGTDLEFLENRIGLNLTYYSEVREDEIVNASLSTATGYNSYLTNAGSTERSGFEVTFEAVPVLTRDFRWDATINWSANETIVTSLPEGLTSYELGYTAAFGYVSLTHRLDEEWGQLRGPGILKDENGTPVVNSDGLYLVEQGQYFGSVLPDWTGGILNSFFYKGLALTASIDFQKGGNFFTLSEQWGQYSGLLEETAELNDRGTPKRDPVAEDGGVHVTGVDEAGNPVDRYVNAQTYYKQFQDNTIAEPFIRDASFVKLRALSLSYTLPQRWVGDFVNSASVGVVGRNLWLIAVSDDNVHGWDPSELAETYGENGQLPGTRSIGFNIKVTF